MFRSPATHHMSPWVRKVFTQVMPRILLMRRPVSFCQGSCGDDRKKKNIFNGIDSRFEPTPWIYAHTYRRDPMIDKPLPLEPNSPNELTATFELRSSSYGSYTSTESRQPIYHSTAFFFLSHFSFYSSLNFRFESSVRNSIVNSIPLKNSGLRFNVSCGWHMCPELQILHL